DVAVLQQRLADAVAMAWLDGDDDRLGDGATVDAVADGAVHFRTASVRCGGGRTNDSSRHQDGQGKSKRSGDHAGNCRASAWPYLSRRRCAIANNCDGRG